MQPWLSPSAVRKDAIRIGRFRRNKLSVSCGSLPQACNALLSTRTFAAAFSVMSLGHGGGGDFSCAACERRFILQLRRTEGKPLGEVFLGTKRFQNAFRGAPSKQPAQAPEE